MKKPLLSHDVNQGGRKEILECRLGRGRSKYQKFTDEKILFLFYFKYNSVNYLVHGYANPPDINQILDGITRKGFKEKSGITRNILKQKL